MNKFASVKKPLEAEYCDLFEDNLTIIIATNFN